MRRQGQTFPLVTIAMSGRNKPLTLLIWVYPGFSPAEHDQTSPQRRNPISARPLSAWLYQRNFYQRGRTARDDDCALATLNDLAITARPTPTKRQLKAATVTRKLAARMAFLCASTPKGVQGKVCPSSRLAEI